MDDGIMILILAILGDDLRRRPNHWILPIGTLPHDRIQIHGVFLFKEW